FRKCRGQVENNLQWMLGQELQGSIVGIVGLGNIGQAIVKRLKGFDVGRFVYTDYCRMKAGICTFIITNTAKHHFPIFYEFPFKHMYCSQKLIGAHFVSLDELLEQSDLVIVATPLTNETRGMFNDNAFSKMKKTAVFVNIGCGEVVNTKALVKALRSNSIFAAGLDITDPEPLSSDHQLLKLPNVGQYH
ncbi:glyoxylate reductase/hydroxypyruvate reductase-like, partial [Megachile rotundata]|uniref:glyoxylate reductase/hydroxypyruvate reductase-like n=1 Tax=Megachile rotundata TaxID=143995 RepID=UPI003FD18F05